MALDTNFESAIVEQLDGLANDTMNLYSETIFQETFEVSEFAKNHTVLTDVRHGKIIPIIETADIGDMVCGMPFSDGSDCSFNECDTDISFASQKWNIAEYNCRFDFCFRTMSDAYNAYWGTYKQTLEDPTTSSDWSVFWNYLLDQRILPKSNWTLWRNGYFGDSSLTSNDYLQGIDGYFTQAMAGDGYKATITKVGSDPTGEEIVNSIKTSLEANDGEFWLTKNNVVIKMPWIVANKVVIYLNSLDNLNGLDCSCVSPDGITRASRFTVQGLTLFGIPVEVHREIDGVAGASCVDGNKWQVLIAPKSNILVGAETSEKMNEFRIFYNKDERKVKVDLSVRFGVALLLNEYIYLTTDPITT